MHFSLDFHKVTNLNLAGCCAICVQHITRQTCDIQFRHLLTCWLEKFMSCTYCYSLKKYFELITDLPISCKYKMYTIVALAWIFKWFTWDLITTWSSLHKMYVGKTCIVQHSKETDIYKLAEAHCGWSLVPCDLLASRKEKDTATLWAGTRSVWPTRFFGTKLRGGQNFHRIGPLGPLGQG